MQDLIKTLKAQHQAVVKMVGVINDKLATGDVVGVNGTLTELKTALLGHLGIEDSELYPALIRAADSGKQGNVSQTTKMFSESMIKITDALKAFLSKFEGKQFDPKSFQTEWTAIVGVLSARIKSEESTLYPMYEQWVSKR